MKTRDRILLVSLDLFNKESEQSVTTVDIANELDISPGNLYYHFKGKESIIEALYGKFETELFALLAQSLEKDMTVEEHWLFLYVLFEEIYKFRFFYLNAANILIKYPDIERRFRRLLSLKIETIEALCLSLMKKLEVDIDVEDIRLLSENIVQSMLYWFPYQRLINPKKQDAELIHKGVYHILNLIAPYTGDNHAEYMLMIKAVYQQHQ